MRMLRPRLMGAWRGEALAAGDGGGWSTMVCVVESAIPTGNGTGMKGSADAGLRKVCL